MRVLLSMAFTALFCCGPAAATTLTFDATYQYRYVFSGQTSKQDTIFVPFSFTFGVTFDPAVLSTNGPNLQANNITVPFVDTVTDGDAHTYFGSPSFSPTPVTQSLQ